MKLINWVGQIAFLIAVLTTLGHRFGILNYPLAFPLFMLALFVCTLIVVTGLILMAMAWFKNQTRPKDLLLLVVACAIFPLIAISAVGGGALKAPMIHDITTDIKNPPVFRFIEPDDGYRINSLIYAGGEVSDQQAQAYPDIKTFFTQVPSRQVYQQALLVATMSGCEVIAQDLRGFHFEAVCRTPLFGFIDDIAVRITPLAERASAVDVRSMSRVGLSDFGANAKRIRGFFDGLQQELIVLQ